MTDSEKAQWEAENRQKLIELDAKPWRGACPQCWTRLWFADSEDEARQLVQEHIDIEHRMVPQVWPEPKGGSKP